MRITVIVCTYNRSRSLARALNSVAGLQFGPVLSGAADLPVPWGGSTVLWRPGNPQG